MGFFKAFAKGLLYVILSPFILAGFAIFAVYSIGVFIFESIVWFIKFSKGDKLSVYTAEDEQVYIMIKGPETAQNNQTVNNNTQIDNSTTNTDNSSHNTENKTININIIGDNQDIAKKLLEAQQNGGALNIEELQKALDELKNKQLEEQKPEEIEVIETSEDLPQIDMMDDSNKEESKDNKNEEKSEEIVDPFPDINIDDSVKKDYGDFPDFDK